MLDFIKKYHLYLIHIFLSGPLLIWIGYFKPTSKIPYILLLLAAIILILKFGGHSIGAWMLVHLLLFVVLLGYAGYIGTFRGPEKLPGFIYGFLLAVGIAAFGYHLLRLIDILIKNK